MKKYFLACLLLLLSVWQPVFGANPQKMLKTFSDSLRFSKDWQIRAAYNDSFKLLLGNLLSEEKPFSLSLDSVSKTISVLNSTDGRMRVITWIYVNDREEFFNYGVVLYRKRPGAAESVFWLSKLNGTDKDSLYADYGEDEWPDALYYQMYDFKKKGRTYYCVLGLNGLNSFCNRKIIDVLWVENDELHIGAPVFYKSEQDHTPQCRVYFEYADQSSMTLRFEKTEKMITYSNLVPSQQVLTGRKQYYIPDGRIDYYKLRRKGKWVRYEGLAEFDLPGNP